jgi:hypothetical protein
MICGATSHALPDRRDAGARVSCASCAWRIEADGRIRSGRVIDVLSRLVSDRGAPSNLSEPTRLASARTVHSPLRQCTCRSALLIGIG